MADISVEIIETNIDSDVVDGDTIEATVTETPITVTIGPLSLLAATDGNIIVGDGTSWVAESGTTARKSLGVPREATLTVAASDSKFSEADYVCDGTADDVQIQAAIDALPAGGGKVILSEGTFDITATLTMVGGGELSGQGWATILDVSGIAAAASDAITMADGCVVRSIKILGDISVLETEGRVLQAGDNCNIESVWISNNNYGISCVGFSNIHIWNIRFDSILGVNNWASCINASGSDCHEIFIDGVYIDTCDRGIEIEDGASKVWAKNGYINAVVGDISSVVLDVHSHTGAGTVKDVVFENWYVKDSQHITARGFDLVDDYVENIIYKNITIDSPFNDNAIEFKNARNCKAQNIKIITSHLNVLFATTSENIIFDGIDVENDTLSNLCQFEDSKYILLKNSTFKTLGASHYGLFVRGGEYVTIRDCTVKDFKVSSGIYLAHVGGVTDLNHALVDNCVVIADGVSPGHYGIFTGSGLTNIDIRNCRVVGALIYSMRLIHEGGRISGNKVDGSIRLEAAAADIEIFDNETGSGRNDAGATNCKWWDNEGDVDNTRIIGDGSAQDMQIIFDDGADRKLAWDDSESAFSLTDSLYPTTDDAQYLGKNDDDTPFAWKGVILKDTTNGKYYRIEVINSVVTATDLTD